MRRMAFFVFLLALPVAAEEPAKTGDEGGPAIFGLQTLKILGKTGPDTLDLAKGAGATGIRATPNLAWWVVEPVLGGAYEWTKPDEALKAVQSRGLDYYRIIIAGRPEYNSYPKKYERMDYLLPQKDPKTGEDLWKHYQKFVGDVVRRYCRRKEDGNPDAMPGLTRPIKLWSYTPEINTFWVPDDDPVRKATDYAAMFNLTRDAIHAADPEAKVLLPFDGTTYLAAFAGGYLPKEKIRFKGHVLDREGLLEKHPEAKKAVEAMLTEARPDGYDLHLYGDPESIPGQKAWLLATLKALGLPEKDVYSMEGGEPYGAVGEDSFEAGPEKEDPRRLAFQSAAMVRHVALAFSSGFRAVTFNLSPEYQDSGAWFGDLDLTDAEGKPRPAYATFKLCREKLVPFATAAEVPKAAGPGGVRVFRFTFAAPKGDVWVAWDADAKGLATSAHDLSEALGFATARVTHPVVAAGETEPKATSEATASLDFGAVPVFVEKGQDADPRAGGKSPR